MANPGTRALEEYQQRARAGRERFIEQHPHLFLVRIAPPQASGDDPWSDDLSFTTHVAGLTNTDDDDDDDYSTHEIGWIIAPVVKREGGPFPDRIGVGRARNCDVVLRLPAISKLHAQFRIGDPLTLVDLGSANGTRVNGEALAPRVPRPVQVGDRVELGGVSLQLVNADRLFNLLRG